ncbi:ABC transporter ATP-binding protein [Actinomyces sp. ZJ308]|uniref:ATP-binding cassette domain-containing protein n=1 Tax=Actinomyces sp. ZJ308 TaxID=2708342 RepID=UPI00141FEA3D|nr:ABC transporter ATP-binding protein [Actinomyces sp. ZJ308]
MNRAQEPCGPAPDPPDWYRTFETELACHGLPVPEVSRTSTSTRAEAEAAGVPPFEMYGPAVLYAREVASALRDYQGTVAPPAPGSWTGNPTDLSSTDLVDASDHSVPVDSAEQAPTATTIPADAVPSIAPVVLRLTNVSVHRGRRTVLSGISLTVHRGEVVAVVGANGAGKSTLLQLCAGLLRAESGRIERTPRFGYAPQLDSLAPLLTVDEHLRLFGAARGMPRGRSVSTGHRLLTRLGWTARGDQNAGTLSGGTQQKLNVALAQLDAPDLLLLDEPYQGLDALAYEDLWALISSWRASGAGVLLVTHLLRDVDLVDRVIELPAPQEGSGRSARWAPRWTRRKEPA